MNDRFAGKVALVTGGSSGIGQATAIALADAGARVFITGRNSQALQATVARHPEQIHAVVADGSQMRDIRALSSEIGSASEHLDIIVANAGRGAFLPLGALTEDSYADTFDLNVKGVIFLVQELVPLLRAGGSIVLMSSITGRTGTPAFSLYSASKAAVRALARNWVLDLKERRIRVNVVSPGPIDTPGLDALVPDEGAAQAMKTTLAAQIPLGRLGHVDEVAQAVLFLTSDEASFINGVDLAVDGGMSEV